MTSSYLHLLKFFARNLVISLIVSLALEVAVFNLPHWMSLGFASGDTGYELTYGSGLSSQGKDTFVITDPLQARVTVSGISTKVENLLLDVNGPADYLDCRIWITDEANSVPQEVPSARVVKDMAFTQYVRLHTQGESQEIVIGLDNAGSGATVTIKDLALNVKVPLSLSPLRWGFLFFVCFAFCAFRPSSLLYDVQIRRGSLAQTFGLGLCLIGMVVATSAISLNSQRLPDQQPDGEGGVWLHEQYSYLEESLVHGRVDLDLPVYEWLSGMDNPYDAGARNLLATPDEPYYIDCAFHDGRYYSYFGVVPALLVGVPLRLMMGRPPRTTVLVTIWMVVSQVGLFLLLREIALIKEQRCSLGTFLLAWMAAVLGAGLFWQALVSQTYAVPYASGMGLVWLGLFLWLRGRARLRTGRPCSILLFFGSVCAALTLGCRPTFAICVLLAPVLFRDELRERHLKLIDMLACAIPFVVIWGGLGAYNLVRFGSFFDFGASYNLTSNDMTHRGFQVARIPLGLFEYLIQPPLVNAAFPFIHGMDAAALSLSNDYHGTTSTEGILAGYLVASPLVLLALKLAWRDRESANRTFWWCVVLSCVMLIVVTEYSGITQRYLSDIGLLLAPAASSVAMTAMDRTYEGRPSHGRNTIKVMMGCVIWSCIITLAQIPFAGAVTLLEPLRIRI